MKDWSKILKSYKDSDIYTIKQDDNIDEIEKLALVNGYSIFKIDLTGILTKQGFLSSSAKAMQFPSYFGLNWDAFEECLTDLEWCTAMGYVIIFEAVGSFTQIAPDEIKMARNIFKAVVKYWKKQKKPFYVLLVDK